MTTPKLMPVRLEDVAQRVGVSRSEVSRVLNGRLREGKDVGAATRDRIIAAALEMNYRPHRAAQNLARGRTDTAALMIMMSENHHPSSFLNTNRELSPHYHEIIGGLAYTLSEYGIHLLLAQCGGHDADPISEMEKVARSRVCDGMVITDMTVNDMRPKLLAETGLPFVVRGSSPISNVPAVGMDNVDVGYRAIEYLYSLGHRNIMFFNIGRDLMSGQRRFEGFCKARNEFNLQDQISYRDDTHGEDGVYTAVMERIEADDIPTAIFAADEVGALGAERALIQAGLRVPEDVSVMTCLNARFMRLLAPHLTVLNVRQNEVAVQVGHLMARLLHGESVQNVQSYVSPVLEVGKSTGPPRTKLPL